MTKGRKTREAAKAAEHPTITLIANMSMLTFVHFLVAICAMTKVTVSGNEMDDVQVDELDMVMLKDTNASCDPANQTNVRNNHERMCGQWKMKESKFSKHAQ